MMSACNSSMVKEALKNICYSDGWCYGILWGFDQTNSLLLTLKDAYFKEEMVALMDNVMLQVHCLGEGVIGQVAFTKSNKWMFSDSHQRRKNSVGSLESLHGLQDDSEFYREFSVGIKTIALISVEQWGVVQLGSTQKVFQQRDLVEQVKEIFRGIYNSQDVEISENAASSSDQFMDSSTQIISGSANQNFQYGAVFEDLMVSDQTPNVPSQSFASVLDHESINSLFTPSFLVEDNIQIGSKPAFEPGNFFGDCSMLVSSWPNSGSAWIECSPFAECSKDMLNSQHPTSLSLDDLLHGISFSDDLSKRCTAEDYSQCFAPLLGNELSHSDGFTPLSNFDGLNSPSNIFQNVPTNSMQSSVTHVFKSNRGEERSDTNAFDHFDGFAGGKMVQGRKETLGPVMDDDVRNFSSGSSECISGEYAKSKVRPANSLFSQLGLDQILNGMGGCSSSPKRRKVDGYPYSQNQGKAQGVSSFDEQVKSVITACQPDRTSIIELSNSEGFSKQTSFYGGDSCSISNSPMRQGEHARKKKAKPGSKPRPKDRQMIQDRLAELRELIPNGEKMSIDRLLERTIRHMNFMQGVKRHAESVKNLDLQKGERKEKDLSSKGATWACELGDQSMICPLIVEDLSTPGQMLIEILCEEHSFFLEIAEIIRSFGLTILKGVMDDEKTKIWARYVVESEGNRHVSRHEIFSSLIQLLQMTGQSSDNTNDRPNGAMKSGAPSLFKNCEPGVMFPMNLADGVQCGSML